MERVEQADFCLKYCKDTPLEGVKLVIESVPVKIQCQGCRRTWEVDTPMFQCPDCQDTKVEMISGREIEITSLELATGERARDDNHNTLLRIPNHGD